MHTREKTERDTIKVEYSTSNVSSSRDEMRSNWLSVGRDQLISVVGLSGNVLIVLCGLINQSITHSSHGFGWGVVVVVVVGGSAKGVVSSASVVVIV